MLDRAISCFWNSLPIVTDILGSGASRPVLAAYTTGCRSFLSMKTLRHGYLATQGRIC